MDFARVLLGVTLLTTSLSGCGSGQGSMQAREMAAADSAKRVADSVAKAASSGKRRVATVMIGKRLGSEKRIAEPTFQFAPQETVYVSFGLHGAPAETKVSARWLAQNGKTLDSTVQTVPAAAGGNTEFHLAPAKGWQPGTYLVTLYLNDDSVDAKTFAVRK